MDDRDCTELKAAFGRVVRKRRDGMGLNQQQFGERVGLHRTYIGAVERGERSIGIEVMARIARGLGVKLSWLMAEAETDQERS